MRTKVRGRNALEYKFHRVEFYYEEQNENTTRYEEKREYLCFLDRIFQMDEWTNEYNVFITIQVG